MIKDYGKEYRLAQDQQVQNQQAQNIQQTPPEDQPEVVNPEQPGEQLAAAPIKKWWGWDRTPFTNPTGSLVKDYGREYKRSDYNLTQNMPPAEIPVYPNTGNPAAINVGVTPTNPSADGMQAMSNPVDELKAKNKQIQQDVSDQKGGYDPNSANSVQQKEMEKRRQELIKRLQERQTQGSAPIKDYGREYKKSSKE